MKGYWLIMKEEVADQAAQAEYGRLWAPIAAKYKAVLNPASVSSLLKEARDGAKFLIVEFPSYEAARICYEDPAYREAKSFAMKASKRDLVIIGGDLG
ncbi:MAG: DUF1330 domain-containing protein [Pikeienuella sp.]